MGGDEVAGKKLLFPARIVKFVKEVLECQKAGIAGLVHEMENLWRYLFGGYFHLAGKVMAYKLFEVGSSIFLVYHDHVVAYARGYKDMFDARQLPEFSQEVDLEPVGHAQVRCVH